jgi:hypothetical protein
VDENTALKDCFCSKAHSGWCSCVMMALFILWLFSLWGYAWTKSRKAVAGMQWVYSGEIQQNGLDGLQSRF